MANKVFPFITKTVNPLGGQCPHRCSYCWRHQLVNRFPVLAERYLGSCWLDESRLKPLNNPDDFVFLCDMTDLMAITVPDRIIEKVLDFVRASKAKFLIQTKNPERFFDFLDYMPNNVVLSSSIESNRNYPSLGKAPSQTERLEMMTKLRSATDLPLFIAIEPILDFDLKSFVDYVRRVDPSSVVVGYDNYNHKMAEPSLAKTLKFIEHLEKFTYVHKKTLRNALGKPGFENESLPVQEAVNQAQY